MLCFVLRLIIKYQAIYEPMPSAWKSLHFASTSGQKVILQARALHIASHTGTGLATPTFSDRKQELSQTRRRAIDSWAST